MSTAGAELARGTVLTGQAVLTWVGELTRSGRSAVRQAGARSPGELTRRHRARRDGADSRRLPEVRGFGRADVPWPELARGRPRLERAARRHPPRRHRARRHRARRKRPGLHRPPGNGPPGKLVGRVRLVAGGGAAGAPWPVKARCPRKLLRRKLLPRKLLPRKLLRRKLLPRAERLRTRRTRERAGGARRPVAGRGAALLAESDLAITGETVAVLPTARPSGVGRALIRRSRLGGVRPAAVGPVRRRRAALRHAAGECSRILRPRLLRPGRLLGPVGPSGRPAILAAPSRTARPEWPACRARGARPARSAGTWSAGTGSGGASSTLPAWPAPAEILARTRRESRWRVTRTPVVGPPGGTVRRAPLALPEVGV